MIPSDKNPKIDEVLDIVSESAGFGKRKDSIRRDVCVFCKEPALNFRDELSRKEYTISGMCQECQDKMFGS